MTPKLAAERLRLLNATFQPTSRRFLLRDAPAHPDVAVDLGCGPGATTTLLRSTTQPRRTIGIDSSPAFLTQARDAVADAEFLQADLSVEALPPADLLYARYLLSHLPEPQTRIAAWQAALRPGGRLLVEENSRLRIHHPVFRRYEDAVAVVMGTGGGDLYVGERLTAVADRVTATTVSPPAGVIARLFGMNLVTWGRNPAVAGLDVQGLAADLQSLQPSDEVGLVVFELAQLTFEATSSA